MNELPEGRIHRLTDYLPVLTVSKSTEGSASHIADCPMNMTDSRVRERFRPPSKVLPVWQ